MTEAQNLETSQVGKVMLVNQTGGKWKMAENKDLRSMLGIEIPTTMVSGKGNYNKKAIPFDMADPEAVEALKAIKSTFGDPWSEGNNYTRPMLGITIGVFCRRWVNGEVHVITAEQFDKYVRPHLEAEEEAVAEVEADDPEVVPDFTRMTNKQLKVACKAAGLKSGNKAAMIERLQAHYSPEESEPEVEETS